MRFNEFNSIITEAKVGRDIQHPEDLILDEGSAGALRGIQLLKSLAKPKNVSIKFDGSPAVIFGRDERGNFIFTDKAGFAAKGYNGKATSPDEVKNMLLNRSGGKNKENLSYVQFANNMQTAFVVLEKSISPEHRGYFVGDMMYFAKPQLKGDYYIFQPNVVTYKVLKNSELGKKISKSKVGIAIHNELDANYNKHPFMNKDVIVGNAICIFEPVMITQTIDIDIVAINKAETFIRSNKQNIDQLLNTTVLKEKKISGFPGIIYNYINSKVENMNNLGHDFFEWLEANPKISANQKQNITNHVQENVKGYSALWKIISFIVNIKNDIIQKLDSAELDIKAEINGKPGGEGYVVQHPKGSIKLVDRTGFTAINRSIER